MRIKGSKPCYGEFGEPVNGERQRQSQSQLIKLNSHSSRPNVGTDHASVNACRSRDVRGDPSDRPAKLPNAIL